MSSPSGAPGTYTVLASVSEKAGLVEFMTSLRIIQKTNGRVLKILSTGGTAKTLRDAGFDVTDVSDYTGVDEMMDGRVKTLHPKVHGGLLRRKGIDDAVVKANDIIPIDMAVVNLYPFEETIAKPDVTPEDAIENIDIGGPSMVRSSAKNHAEVTIVTSPTQYASVLADLRKNAGQTILETREKLARMAFEHTAHYDTAIAYYLAKKEADLEYEANGGDDRKITPDNPLHFNKPTRLKYGENPQQKYAYFIPNEKNIANPLGLANFSVIEGTLPSFVGFTDIARLVAYLEALEQTTGKDGKNPAIALGAKHGNTCGAAIHEDPVEATKAMVTGNSLSIFGGAILLSFPVTEEVMDVLLHYGLTEDQGDKRILDEIIAPSFDPKAVKLAVRRKGKCRFITNSNLVSGGLRMPRTQSIRAVDDGVLVQDAPNFVPTIDQFTPTPTPEVWRDMQLAWAIGSRSTSNTITIVKDGQLIGNGVGQQDRKEAAKLAVERATEAGHSLEGAVAYSDSFFPFPDGVEVLINAGVKTIFATSGSINDDKVRAACEAAGVMLYTVPDKEGRGFSQHG